MDTVTKCKLHLCRLKNLLSITLTAPVFGLGIAFIIMAFNFDCVGNWLVASALWLRGHKEEAKATWEEFKQENF